VLLRKPRRGPRSAGLEVRYHLLAAAIAQDDFVDATIFETAVKDKRKRTLAVGSIIHREANWTIINVRGAPLPPENVVPFRRLSAAAKE
jgi:hypothetical protein